ncbi:SusE domain-containing protein [Mucilaginibacter celer]|uniref:SusF/SusE family outer membrane protein n=1 Tax=Mucilaginibacter celer TaxID=2305508 RepID=A0A494VNU9_9SPHI|nr:SusE domain-containing protein [Mucilaginibacter celer]AYL94750.1 SusF/SusE family outer membrane protein [Mucilaginibacter celer]
MKKIFTTILAIGGIALLMLASCKKDETKVVANVGKVGALTSTTTTPELSKPNAANDAVTFSWAATSVTGYKAPITYTVQVDVKGNNFKNAREVSTDKLTQTLKVGVLNDMLIALKLSYNDPSQVEVRIKSSAAPNLAATYSNVVTLTVLPYQGTGYIYAPGAYQGWEPKTADSLISPNNDGVYDANIGFAAGKLEFKLTPKRTWDVSWGNAGGGNISTAKGDNLSVPSPGYYAIHVVIDQNDKSKGTFTATQQFWSIIGDATPNGWGGDTDMAYDADAKTWSVTSTLIGGKEMKFRFNHDWGVNLGGPLGALTNGGDNIKITSDGTYRIVLDANAKTCTITKL